MVSARVHQHDTCKGMWPASEQPKDVRVQAGICTCVHHLPCRKVDLQGDLNNNSMARKARSTVNEDMHSSILAGVGDRRTYLPQYPDVACFHVAAFLSDTMINLIITLHII